MNWTDTDTALPTERALVEWQRRDGEVVRGYRLGKLWFFEDWSMYVYYTPQRWRYVEKAK